jgi:hypothetical protein
MLPAGPMVGKFYFVPETKNKEQERKASKTVIYFTTHNTKLFS